MTRLNGKTVLVTGGRQGIGRAIVEAMTAEGAAVLTCGRGDRPEDLDESVKWVATDVSNTAAVSALKRGAEEIFDGLDILVNNAGIQVEKTVVESSDEDWENVMGVNARGVFNVCRAFIPFMKNGGSIINIGSISGLVADPSMALYNASKAFVHGLTRSIAVDHGPAIRCNAICPGWILTDMADAAFDLAQDRESARKDALKRHPAGRFGRPEDVAQLALWLASDQSSFATGQCYSLDGGLTAASPLQPGFF